MVVGGVRRAQERGLARYRHHGLEVEDVGVEGGRACDVAYIEDDVVEAVDAHDFSLRPSVPATWRRLGSVEPSTIFTVPRVEGGDPGRAVSEPSWPEE